ncbi:MAG: hypothetical protein J6C37_04315 [Roseburia sp.]|nr:hypothetical protein [Roseburia sp.]
MSKSLVTEYFITYFKKHHISPEETARALGIDVGKLTPGYREPLDAEEFLELCVYLGICPEQVAQGIRENITQ